MAHVSKHSDEYDAWFPFWLQMRRTRAGDADVKAAGILYLPMLSGQKTEAEYNSYKNRAVFYGATGRTIDALVGAIFRKPPQATFNNEQLDEQLKNVDLAGTSFSGFSKVVCEEIMTVGRVGVFLDMPSKETPEEDRRPFIICYKAEQILSWRKRQIGSATVVDQIVLYEVIEEPDENEHGIGRTCREQWRVLELDEAGLYRVRLFEAELLVDPLDANKTTSQMVETEVVEPTVSGERLKFIPFVFFSALGTDANVIKPPLLDLSNVNVAHYRRAADYEHGLHLTALPTVWIQTSKTGKVYALGGIGVLEIEPDMQCGMLEYIGQGLRAIKDAQNDDEWKMAKLGARMLEQQPKAIEAEGALKIRQSGEANTLSSTSETMTDGFMKLMTWWSEWVPSGSKKIECKFNTDFIDKRLEPSQAKDLMFVYLQDGMSLDTLLWNFQEGELHPPGVTIEQEAAKIKAQAATTSLPAPKDATTPPADDPKRKKGDDPNPKQPAAEA